MQKNTESVGKWISILYRYAQIYLSRELEGLGIGSGQHIYLLELFKEEGVSQEKLSEKLCMDKATTARALDKLIKEDYVYREVDAEDKRAYKLYVTDKAIRIRPKLYDVMSKWTDVLVGEFESGEKEILLKLLNKMSKNAASFINK